MTKRMRHTLLLATTVLMGGLGYILTRPEPVRAAECGQYCGGVSCHPTGMERACEYIGGFCSNSMCGA